jgi:hypothetical protein
LFGLKAFVVGPGFQQLAKIRRFQTGITEVVPERIATMLGARVANLPTRQPN